MEIQANDLPDRTLRFVVARLKSFAHYHGLRAFKEKFATGWSNHFLVYEREADLIGIAAGLRQVEKTR